MKRYKPFFVLFCLISLLLATGCAPHSVRTKTKLLKQERARKVERLFQNKTRISWGMSVKGLKVFVKKAPFCVEQQGDRETIQKTTVRSMPVGAFVSSLVGGILLTGAGIYFVASGPARPALNDQYSRDELSSEGAYGIGAVGLVAGASMLAVAIGTAIKAKDTAHPPQERFVVSTRRKVVCGRYQPVSGAQVTFVVPKHMRYVTTTDKKGRALIPLAPEKLGSMSTKAAEGGALLVGKQEVPVNLTTSDIYRKAVREATEKRLAKQVQQQRQHKAQILQTLRKQGVRLLKQAKTLYNSNTTLVYRQPLATHPSKIRVPQWTQIKVIAKAKGFSGYAKATAQSPYTLQQLMGWIPDKVLLTKTQFKRLRPRTYRIVVRVVKATIICRGERRQTSGGRDILEWYVDPRINLFSAHLTSWNSGRALRDLWLSGSRKGSILALSGTASSHINGRTIQSNYFLGAKTNKQMFHKGTLAIRMGSCAMFKRLLRTKFLGVKPKQPKALSQKRSVVWQNSRSPQ